MYGELVPLGGGDSIALFKDQLRIGRHDDCDIVLDFHNVSDHHALLKIDEGCWFVTDLLSRNGVKVDGKKIMTRLRKRVDPGAVLSIAKHQYEVVYDPTKLGACGSPPQDDQPDGSLLDNI